MGYCHSWGRPKEIAPEVFRAVMDDVQKIVGSVAPTLGLFGGIRIKGATGAGRPLIDAERICFNGSPACETFWIARDFNTKYPDRTPGDDGLYWDFVKTRQLPYDRVVVAALTALKVHLPATQLSSDGGREEWEPGLALFRTATGRDVAFDALTR